jgi:hypothetical protein
MSGSAQEEDAPWYESVVDSTHIHLVEMGRERA